MNTCELIKETLVADGRDSIDSNAALAAHVQGCVACQRLLQAWEQIPQLLEQLPPHEADENLLQRVSDAVAAPRQRSQGGGRRFLAPSLASAAVLLAAIGLSHQLLLHESPTLPIPPDRQRSVGQTLPAPGSEAAAPGFYDRLVSAEKPKAANSPPPAAPEPLEAARDYRSDDAAVVVDRQSIQLGGEFDQARPAGTIRPAVTPEPRPILADETPARRNQSGGKVNLKAKDVSSKVDPKEQQ